MPPQGKKHCILALDDLRHSTAHREVYDLPGVWKVSAAHRDNPRATPISMAYIGNRFILLEKDGLSDSCRCLLKVHHSEEIAQFVLCSHVLRTIYDCHRIRLTPYNQK